MHLGNNKTEGQYQGQLATRVPDDYSDPAYVEGRHYPFHLVWSEASGAPMDMHFDAETKDLARQEVLEFLEARPGHRDASLGDVNGDPVDIEGKVFK